MKKWIPLHNSDETEDMYSRIGGLATCESEDIEVKGLCPICGEPFESDRITVPAPNMLGENNEESMIFVDEPYICEKCGGEINISVDNCFGGVDIEVEGLKRKDIFYRIVPKEKKDEM